ncbi:MAG: L-aspartate oxidase [Betaproteobacteria bacterium AqS2]|uniref:L-aspartate oxidase n=1 Tax=Candidatus Amphirhobacter heronislandensis TaxID=1732024 RepID=A0A930UBP9_9GAMM|nr:L-aspartate oxidase [Betaproteobacteria bacterium AqS2]
MREDPGSSCDVAVIGAGLAGLAHVLALDPSLRVALFCKGETVGGASSWAQGGMAAVVAAGDSEDEHIEDTLRAGRGLCDPAAVAAIVADGGKAVEWLEKQGVAFARSESGDFDLGREGGHGKRRIVHVSDATGAALVAALFAKVQQLPNVTIHTGAVAVDLVVEDGAVRGLYVLRRGSGQVDTVAARAVVLATGGIGKVYRYTTNPDEATGDGVAMAWRAGCQVANMEFVQFHPTALFHPHAKSVLISEACRGEGALLVNAARKRFMPAYHPDAELAPRDVVAQAIDAEIKRTGADCMHLDFAPVPEAVIDRRFPGIKRRCAELGIAIPKDLVPVVPSAHYLCGGIATDIAGATAVAGLYAIGETGSTGLHGANRLASNSLLECIVVARNAAARASRSLPPAPAAIPRWDDSRVGPAHEEVMVAHNWDEIRRMMWNYVGIVRSDERLERAQRRLAVIAEEIGDHYRRFVVSSDFIEVRNLLLCAQLIIRSAAERRESRGLHFNQDCPAQLPEAKSTVLSKQAPAPADIIEGVIHAN